MAITGVKGTNSPNIIIQETASVNGFLKVNTFWVFGVVMVVYPGSLKYQVGDSVFFDKSQGKWFKKITTSYYAIDEQFVYFIETPEVIIP